MGAGFLFRSGGPAEAADAAADAAIDATVEVDPRSPWFAGHFPGDPILPAIGQLDLLRRLRGHLGAPAHLAAVDTLRLAEPVRPGDRLRVEIGGPAADGRSAVALTRVGGDRISHGAVRWADEGGDPRPAAPAPPAIPPGSPADPPLPHVPPARFAHEVLEASADQVLCRGLVPLDHAAVTAGRAPTLTAIELAAQAAAGLDPGSPAPAIGYIVRLRSVELPLPTLPAGADLLARVGLDGRHGPLNLLTFEVTLGETELARGTLGVYLPD